MKSYKASAHQKPCSYLNVDEAVLSEDWDSRGKVDCLTNLR